MDVAPGVCARSPGASCFRASPGGGTADLTKDVRPRSAGGQRPSVGCPGSVGSARAEIAVFGNAPYPQRRVQGNQAFGLPGQSRAKNLSTNDLTPSPEGLQ